MLGVSKHKVDDPTRELNCTTVYMVEPDPACVTDTLTDEIIVTIILVAIVVYTFYRLYYVWVNTLNFSEVEIDHKNNNFMIVFIVVKANLQGPQGWDLLMQLLLTKIKNTKKKMKTNTNIEEGRESNVGKSKSLPVVPVYIQLQDEEDIKSKHLSRHFSV